MICAKCKEDRPIPPSIQARTPGRRWCSRCMNAAPAAKRRRTRWNHSHRIRIGAQYMGYAKSAEQATAIKAHIRRRLREFVKGQSKRAQMEGMASGGVSAEADLRTD